MQLTTALKVIIFAAATLCVCGQDRPRSTAGLTQKFILLNRLKVERKNLETTNSASRISIPYKARETPALPSTAAAPVLVQSPSNAAAVNDREVLVPLASSSAAGSSAQSGASYSAAASPAFQAAAATLAPAAQQSTLFPQIPTIVPLHPAVAALFGLPTAVGESILSAPSIASGTGQSGAAAASIASPFSVSPIIATYPAPRPAAAATANGAPIASSPSASIPAPSPLLPIDAPSFVLPTIAPFAFPTLAPLGPPLPSAAQGDHSYGYPRVPGQEFDGVAVPLPDGNVFYLYCHNCQGK